MTPADEDEFIMSKQLANKGHSLPLNKIIKGNCIKLMKTFPNNSIDVIFADPPYNLQLKNNLSRPDSTKVNGVTEDWDCLLYTSPSPRDKRQSRMPSSA